VAKLPVALSPGNSGPSVASRFRKTGSCTIAMTDPSKNSGKS
jgi:hypothetical protein